MVHIMGMASPKKKKLGPASLLALEIDTSSSSQLFIYVDLVFEETRLLLK
jgi:hypothetical protein